MSAERHSAQAIAAGAELGYDVHQLSHGRLSLVHRASGDEVRPPCQPADLCAWLAAEAKSRLAEDEAELELLQSSVASCRLALVVLGGFS